MRRSAFRSTSPTAWAGRDYAAGTTFLRTYNASPSIAYRLNDWISVGVGVQIQYAKASLNHGVTAFLWLSFPSATRICRATAGAMASPPA